MCCIDRLRSPSFSAAYHEFLSVSFLEKSNLPGNNSSPPEIGCRHLLPLMPQLAADGEPGLTILLAFFRG